jgi:uncharacterized protein YdiU (UPF0061 family)
MLQDDPMTLALQHSYRTALPWAVMAQAPFRAPAPRFVAFNAGLAADLGLEDLAAHPEWLAGAPPEGITPVAMAYSGHQFGNFAPQLGDGRAHLLGEIVTQGGRFDLHLKGSGRTVFSRGGDGKAALGPMLREYLISEAMAALGLPTTRSLAVLTTGETILRQEGPVPGAILARIAASHLRIGTFEWVAARGNPAEMAALLAYAIQRHDPDLDSQDALGFFDRVCARQTRLVAEWMGLGFVHGVMNTDNMTISGETIDYGPCAFIDAYDPAARFSSIDRQGRYRLEMQPRVLPWNLARLAEALLLVLPEGEATVAALNDRLDAIAEAHEAAFQSVMARKLALSAPDPGLVAGFLAAVRGLDWTRALADLAQVAGGAESLFPSLAPWHGAWRAKLRPDAVAALARANPQVIPRNHLVEEALAAAQSGDLAPFEALLAACRQPFAPAPERFTLPPPEGLAPHITYCGT